MNRRDFLRGVVVSSMAVAVNAKAGTQPASDAIATGELRLLDGAGNELGRCKVNSLAFGLVHAEVPITRSGEVWTIKTADYSIASWDLSWTCVPRVCRDDTVFLRFNVGMTRRN